MAQGKRRTRVSSANQRIQRDLVERGLKIPGVAEAMAAYGALEKHADIKIGQAPPVTRYAAGANQ